MNKLINTIAWTVLIYSIAMSTTHIIETGLKIGLAGFAAYTSPILVDAVFALGKLGRLDRFPPAVRKSSLYLMLFGGAMSLTCNVVAGENWGQYIHGILVVVVMIWIESHAAKLAGHGALVAAVVPTVTQADANAAVAAAIAIVQAEAAAMMAQIEQATRAAVVAELTARFDAEREAAAAATAEAAAIKAQQRRNGEAARALAATSPAMKASQLAKATGVSASTAAKILNEAAAVAPVSPGPLGAGPVGPSVAQLDEMVSVPAYL